MLACESVLGSENLPRFLRPKMPPRAVTSDTTVLLTTAPHALGPLPV